MDPNVMRRDWNKSSSPNQEPTGYLKRRTKTEKQQKVNNLHQKASPVVRESNRQLKPERRGQSTSRLKRRKLRRKPAETVEENAMVKVWTCWKTSGKPPFKNIVRRMFEEMLHWKCYSDENKDLQVLCPVVAWYKRALEDHTYSPSGKLRMNDDNWQNRFRNGRFDC